MFREAAAGARPGLAGTLETLPIPYLLWGLHADGFTGVLELHRGDGPAHLIVFKTGGIKHVEHLTPAGDELADLLVEAGRLTPEGRSEAERLAAGEGVRLCEALVRLSLVPESDCARAQQVQVLRRCLRLFRERSLPFAVVADETLPYDHDYTLVNLRSLVLAGLKEAFLPADMAAMHAALAGRSVRLADRFEDRSPPYRFSRADREVLTQLGRPVNFIDALDRLAAAGGDLRRLFLLVAALHVTGDIETGPLIVAPRPEVVRRPAPPAPAGAGAPEDSEEATPDQTDGLFHAEPRQASAAQPPVFETDLELEQRPGAAPIINDALLDPGLLALKRRVLELYAKVDSMTHFELLGIGRAASRDAVDTAWSTLLGTLNPGRVTGTPLADLQPIMRHLCTRAKRAYRTLTTPALRRDYLELFLDPHVQGIPARYERKMQALARQAEAREALEQGRTEEAVERAQAAIALFPALAELHVTYGWALFNRLAGSDREGALRRGEEQMTHALQRDPTCAEAYFTAARMCDRAGRSDRAIDMIRRALALAPREERYRAEAERLKAGR